MNEEEKRLRKQIVQNYLMLEDALITFQKQKVNGTNEIETLKRALLEINNAMSKKPYSKQVILEGLKLLKK